MIEYIKMIDKIIKVLFGLILISTLITVGYYLKYKKNISLSPFAKYSFLSPTSSPSFDATTTELIARAERPIQMTQNIKTGYAINPIFLDSLMLTSKYVKKDVLKSAIYSTIVEGKIVESLFIDKTTYIKNVTIPRFFIVIEGKQGSLHQLGIPQETEKETITWSVFFKNGKTGDLQDLKIGDKVRIKIEMDLTSSNEGKMITTWTINVENR